MPPIDALRSAGKYIHIDESVYEDEQSGDGYEDGLTEAVDREFSIQRHPTSL